MKSLCRICRLEGSQASRPKETNEGQLNVRPLRGGIIISKIFLNENLSFRLPIKIFELPKIENCWLLFSFRKGEGGQNKMLNEGFSFRNIFEITIPPLSAIIARKVHCLLRILNRSEN